MLYRRGVLYRQRSDWRALNSSIDVGGVLLDPAATTVQRRSGGTDNEERRPLPHYFSAEIRGEERTGELQLFFLGLGKRRQG